METYMEPDDINAHLGFQPLIENERGAAKYPIPIGSVVCPKCKGWGGHNLRLNAYGPGKHFKSSCDQCVGWGYVRESDSQCIHEWDYKTRVNVGNCLNIYTCVKCGQKRTVDSSG